MKTIWVNSHEDATTVPDHYPHRSKHTKKKGTNFAPCLSKQQEQVEPGLEVCSLKSWRLYCGGVTTLNLRRDHVTEAITGVSSPEENAPYLPPLVHFSLSFFQIDVDSKNNIYAIARNKTLRLSGHDNDYPRTSPCFFFFPCLYFFFPYLLLSEKTQKKRERNKQKETEKEPESSTRPREKPKFQWICRAFTIVWLFPKRKKGNYWLPSLNLLTISSTF